VLDIYSRKLVGWAMDKFDDAELVKAAIFEYIEVYYNRKRRHSSLEYVSPVEYEKRRFHHF
jgi:transposase InsO family protein